jgi:DNA-binding transcriptional LysR family regulator
MRSTFDMDALRTMVVGIDLGSFARAASQLGRSQSAVSMQLKKLAQQAGRPLLRRDGRGLVATEAGDALLAYARRIIALNDEAAASLDATVATASVRLGLPQDLFEDVMPDAIMRFSRQRPSVHVEVRAGRNHALEEDVRAGRLNVAVAFFQSGSDTHGTRIASCRCCGLVGRDWPSLLLTIQSHSSCSTTRVCFGKLRFRRWRVRGAGGDCPSRHRVFPACGRRFAAGMGFRSDPRTRSRLEYAMWAPSLASRNCPRSNCVCSQPASCLPPLRTCETSWTKSFAGGGSRGAPDDVARECEATATRGALGACHRLGELTDWPCRPGLGSRPVLERKAENPADEVPCAQSGDRDIPQGKRQLHRRSLDRRHRQPIFRGEDDEIAHQWKHAARNLDLRAAPVDLHPL